ncbi:uncharacterized protein PRCAT00004418001 [Priceomyces carsonii]|uniref:uncharacterized protein n=1 Tax=Priceomyces carsonii TaxID=28549 RepID=UPI002ED86614|nr:unnamed protein product [Priceomyces carsonii]
MSSSRAPAPRVVFVRHGQTEWSKSGQYTSVTDLSLTEFGVEQMKTTANYLVGNKPLHPVKPSHLTTVFISPRTRAKQTANLLLENVDASDKKHIKIIESNDIREWEYGDYEGMVTADIRKSRIDRGIDPPGKQWSIWTDGCENGETHVEVQERVDRLIEKIRLIHREAFENNTACDIMLVAHGHILKCFAARWVGRQINTNPQFILDAGGVGVLSYEHYNIEEPALYLGSAL